LIFVLAGLGQDLLGGGGRQVRRHGPVAGVDARQRVPGSLVSPAGFEVGADPLARPLAELGELAQTRICVNV